MWRCFVRDQARVPSVAGAGSSLFRKTEQFFFFECRRDVVSYSHTLTALYHVADTALYPPFLSQSPIYFVGAHVIKTLL